MSEAAAVAAPQAQLPLGGVPAPAAPAVAENAQPQAAVQNEGEQAPPATPEGEQPETPEQAAKRQGRRYERRLSKAFRDAAEAKARADLAERQLHELKAPKAAEGEPKLEQFDDIEKYAAAKAEHAKKQAQAELEAKAREHSGRQYQESLKSGWEEKVDAAADKYDDFQAVVGELQPTHPFIAAIMEADNGPDIAYHLGKNPKEAERLMRLPLVSQIREIGKLEAKLLSTPVEPKTPSKAPAPIKPLTGTTPAADTAPSERDDMKAWMAKRQKQVHGKR